METSKPRTHCCGNLISGRDPHQVCSSCLGQELLVMSSKSPSLPSKSDRLQSALTQWAYRAAALLARVLNVLSPHTAYQAELCEAYVRAHEPACVGRNSHDCQPASLCPTPCSAGHREDYGHPCPAGTCTVAQTGEPVGQAER